MLDSSSNWVLGLAGQAPNTSASSNFASNFVASSYAATYEESFPNFQTGAKGAGDWNARYSNMYFSMTSTLGGALENMQSWTSTCGTGQHGGCTSVTGSPYFCPAELVIAGQYPNARYFSIAGYDEHYTTAQRLADLDIDPLSSNTESPFVGGQTWASGIAYLAPVSLGTVPSSGQNGASGGTASGCQISPYEEDNLLDGTQRHPAGDWNTVATGAAGTNFPSQQHILDDDQHSNPTAAGSIHVRAYLSPPYTCSGNQGSTLTCSLPSNSGFPDSGTGNTYFLLRDTNTGCAYTTTYTNTLIVGNANQGPTPFLSKSTKWQDTNIQMQYHLEADVWNPQLCYANGANLTYHNPVAWTRTPQHVAGSAPDDAYVAASIPAATLQQLVNASAQNAVVMRFRFKLPAMPATPCLNANCALPIQIGPLRYTSLTLGYQAPGTGCAILADIDGQGSCPVQGPDFWSILSLADAAFNTGQTTPLSGNNYSARYVTLIVNVNPAVPMPTGLSYNSTPVQGGQSNQYTVTSTAVTQGAGPVQAQTNHLDGTQTPVPYYTAWVNTTTLNGQPYGDPDVVVDLTKFGDFFSATPGDTNAVCAPPATGSGYVCNYPLILTFRSTMLGPDPNNLNQPFQCSGYSVPYNTAECTNYTDTSSIAGGGFMGPYVPLVDYPLVGSLMNPTQHGCGDSCNVLPPPPVLQAVNLPAEDSCGLFPTDTSGNPILALGNGAQNGTQALFPTQYWPTGGTTTPPNLNCPASNPSGSKVTPSIDFVATQFTTQVQSTSQDSGGACAHPDTSNNTNPCIQVIQQITEQESITYQPPLPLTIVGSGFGYLPGLPWAGTAPSTVLITNDGASGTHNTWSTNDGNLGNCQVYIADWTDTSISLLVGLPNSATNFNGLVLSPLTDMGPLAFFQQTPVSTCPIAINSVTHAPDNINVTVTNPQSLQSETLPNAVGVKPTGTTPIY